ncbi:hypothetical protein KZZ52_40790 [Dactylosporangium sp. AC04546]|uniref:hypothetical protein n=1 Tax=Dactylosporangium sp. AC04546 TaxID=2862460 RepID=UPI001EDF8DAB|nr:hypothetical protein [Dactylosporangium sp. AC04546]WVK80282.1 hypothetical protein KZZ52_40790 [Dactylosporangium sp. AC04546]
MSHTLGGVAGPASRSSAPALTIPRQRTLPPVVAEPRPRRRFATAGLVVSALAVLLFGYLRIARATPTNADGGANALQAWDMLHGNLLLRGWTLSDVSFYPTELVQYALIELVYGLNQDVIHVASAITYTLLIVFAALVAKGEATGRAAWARVALVVAALLVPEPHSGWAVVLYVPDHTGTAVPLLVMLLLADRRARTPLGRWWPAGVAALLAIAQVADPLALFVGAVPLALVSALRLLRDRTWRGPDVHLLLAAVASVAVAQAALALIWRAGGFALHSPIAKLADWRDLPDHAWRAAQATALNYGAYFPHLNDGPLAPLDIAGGVVNLALLLLAAAAILLVCARAVRRSSASSPSSSDPVAELLAAAILCNLGAYVISTQAGENLSSSRQIVAVLPFGAALAARVWGDRLAALVTRPPARWVAGALAAVLVAAFAGQTVTARARPAEAAHVADWLVAHDLRYGLGSYWASNNVTVAAGGAVQVAPVVGPDIRAFRWESKASWYDATLHDARFVVIDLQHAAYGTVDDAVEQFGPPRHREDLGRWTVLVYDHNLLVDLPAQCGGLIAAAHAHCPPLPPKVPGSALFVDEHGD